ncbi:MAG: chromosome segregation protein SMC, partial [Planctomycetota bacterium]
KVEAERRLARVQRNLTRLGDIVDEVAARLKTLQGQASKAERFRQAQNRLQELRTIVAWNDWLSLSRDLDETQIKLDAATAKQAEAEAHQESLQRDRASADATMQRLMESSEAAAQQRTRIEGEIARLSGRLESDTTTRHEIRQTLAGDLRRLRTMRSQAGVDQADLQAALGLWQAAKSAAEAANGEKTLVTQNRDELQAGVAEVQTRRDDMQQRHLTIVRRVAEYEAAQSRVAAEIAEAIRSSEATRELLIAASKDRDDAQSRLDKSSAAVDSLLQRIDEAGRSIEILDAKVLQSRRVLQRRQDEVASLKIRRQGISERAKVLNELQQRHDGISGGVREVLQLPVGPLRSELVGIVADCFSVDTAMAPLIDASLGPRSQYVIVRGGLIGQAIIDGQLKIETRVGFIRLDELPNRRQGDRIRLDGLSGVIGRADRMVDCDDDLKPLRKHLLGNTWLVDSLKTALGLRKLSGAGLRFVTAKGELLDNDGSSVVGPPGGETGLISRRSELSAARQEMEHYEYQIDEGEKEIARLRGEVDNQAADFGREEQARREHITEHAAAEAKHHHAEELLLTRRNALEELEIRAEILEKTRTEAEMEHHRLAALIKADRGEVVDLEQQRDQIEDQLATDTEQLQRVHADAMRVSVEAARLEQRAESLETAAEVVRRDQSQREIARRDAQDAIKRGRVRLSEFEVRIEKLRQDLTHQQQDRLQTESKHQTINQQVDEHRQVVKQLQSDVQVAMQATVAAGETAIALAANRDAALLKQSTLAERIAEDYQIDLRHDSPPEALQSIENREEIDAEIAKLRGQVQSVGSVNMEALEELTELQARYDTLHEQYQDLTAAKDSLQRVISRINADSRRLFLDTLEAIRQNFQRLYRKSFGGGFADLVLEETEDPLEAGVEIVATPPGKPSFNNSLLSGGEKALTAVALLMSIFQYRPSPFCVLDEVDAPFDEANIGRFVTVLSQFLDHSKFVVVTHSKKTMTSATTLYGVTMQESGVSKQVSIRFEDVSDDGRINAA